VDKHHCAGAGRDGGGLVRVVSGFWVSGSLPPVFMDFTAVGYRVDVITFMCPPVRTLAWRGDTLIDPVGGARFELDGTLESTCGMRSYPFDRAIATAEHTVLYTARQTKGIVCGPKGFAREIDRSFYHADAYEYPVALGRLPDGRAALAHCPAAYNRLVLEDPESGAKLCERDGESPDFFHSRLAFSPGGAYILSAGWWWHPFSTVKVYATDELDEPVANGFKLSDAEVEAAAFLDDDRVLVAATTDNEVLDDDEPPTPGSLRPGQFGVWSLSAGAWLQRATLAERTGTIMPAGEEHFVGFHAHPKLFEIRTGRVVERWEHLPTGRQTSSFLRGQEPIPPLALDTPNRRFAVGAPQGVTVVVLAAH
jgi:hypothetical protein